MVQVTRRSSKDAATATAAAESPTAAPQPARKTSFLSSMRDSQKETAIEDIDDISDVGENHSVTGAGSTSKTRGSRCVDGCIQISCLKPHLSLRRQLFLSFGSVCVVSLSFVMITAFLTALKAGDSVKTISRDKLVAWAETKLTLKSRYVAETIDQKFQNFESMAGVVREVTMDRFAGYPSKNDSRVPFHDIDSNQNRYPLDGDLIPVDWMVENAVDEEGESELLQGRTFGRVVSSLTCSIHMQGACDPNETDPNSLAYHPNCTEDHNNITHGGVLAPTDTFSMIHNKVSDYCAATLRPLYEYQEDVQAIAVHFVNSGAGATVFYPGLATDGKETYVSAGCDWMRQKNPLNASKRLGTEAEISRCHPAGTLVSSREFNPNEASTLLSRSLEPNKIHFGRIFESQTKRGLFIFTMSQSIYDRVTQALIGIVTIRVDASRFGNILNRFKVTPSSEVMLVRWDEEGTVVSSGNFSGLVPISDLDVGIDNDAFKAIQQSFEEQYTPDTYDPSSLHTTMFLNGRFISTSLIPIPPDEYNPDYRPDFLLIGIVPEQDILGSVNYLDDAVNNQVDQWIRTSLIAGFAGLAVALTVIYLVSLFLTKPLAWMNQVGDSVIHNFGSSAEKVDFEQSRWVRFSPKTEITYLALEFQQMMTRFSGSGVAKLFKKKSSEVRNPFDLTSNFSGLYAKRNNANFEYRYQEEFEPSCSPLESSASNLMRVQWGRNTRNSVCGDATFVSALQDSVNGVLENKNLLRRSRLFWWIGGSITVPLLLTMIAISVLVAVELSLSLPNLTNEVQDFYVDLEKISLLQSARMRAAFASEVMSAPVRDLHAKTRLTAWLLFGAIRRAASYTEFTMTTDECKGLGDGECSFWDDRERAVCDCAWDDPWGETCYEYSSDTRDLQLLFYEGQSDDVAPNGDRNSTSYPLVGRTASDVSFWPNMTAVPGVEKGSNASGHDTTYDRLRVMSATSVMQVALYNYGVKSRPMGTYVGFEAGGIFGGYAGCYHGSVGYSKFQATESNTFNRGLCPIGKYGFDPRCRGWYVTGKEIGLSNDADLYVTPPYVFVAGGLGQSATQSLIDPVSGEYVGQTLVDFSATPVFQSLTQKSTPLIDGSHILISPREDEQGSDTIIAPGFEFDGSFGAIGNYVLPNGSPDDSKFNNILKAMRSGESDLKSFVRFDQHGSGEAVYIAYAPVSVTNLRAINASDFSRGVHSFTTTIFSLALTEKVDSVAGAFDSIEQSLHRTSTIAIVTLVLVIALALLSMLYISSRVTVSIITPVAQLLLVVININRQEINEDLPYIFGGSSEVSRVQQTFELLYMLLRFANTAFFSGELSKAYDSLKEANALFLKLDNQKAVGITNNNLGNIMLTMYRTMKTTGTPMICGLTKSDIIANGIQYFDSAIDGGEKALARTNDEEGWSTNYLVFMQQLSNRYFNRAMFLLTVKDDHPSPAAAEQQGTTDLATAKDMDREVVDNGEETGFKGENDLHFDLLLFRIKGILSLLEIGYEDNWGLEELFAEGLGEIKGGLKIQANELFREFEPAAQMQRLDSELILYYKLNKNKHKAAEVAIRMLVEDEYILSDAGVTALNALIEYVADVKASDLGGVDPSDIRSSLFQFRRQITDSVSHTRHGKNVVSRESLRMSNMGDISMEMF